MNTVTVKSAANLALLKYWGLDSDGQAFLPSISIPLPQCFVETEISFVEDKSVQELQFEGKGVERIHDFIQKFLEVFGLDFGYQVRTKGSVPVAIGVASSAAGFSALAKGLCELAGVDVLDKRVYDLVRSQSGSALRSLLPGVVEWRPEDYELVRRDDLEAFALTDLICVVSEESKLLSSKELHQLVPSSTLFEERLKNFADRYHDLESAMFNDDWNGFASVVEEEAWSLLLQAWSCDRKVPLLKLASLRLWELVKHWQAEGLQVCVSFDAGATVHVLCRPAIKEELKKRLSEMDLIVRMITE